METFGTRLARIRKEHNLTQSDIAEKLCISSQAVSKWENDLTAPDIDTLIELSNLFDISLDELFGKEKKETIFVPEKQRKNVNQMTFKIVINSKDGDNIKVNLPMAIVKIFVNSDSKNNIISGNKALEGIDFNQLIELVEQGVIGELLSVESADGDHVQIMVE